MLGGSMHTEGALAAASTTPPSTGIVSTTKMSVIVETVIASPETAASPSPFDSLVSLQAILKTATNIKYVFFMVAKVRKPGVRFKVSEGDGLFFWCSCYGETIIPEQF